MDTSSDGEFPLPDNHWINASIPEEDDKTLLFVALQGKLYDFVQVLLQAGASAKLYNKELKRYPIHVAAQTGDPRCMKLLFQNPKNQPEVNVLMGKVRRTALHVCAENGFEDCMDVLLQQPNLEVDIKDQKGEQTALYLAVKNNSSSMARKLLAHGASPQNVCFGKCIADMMKEKMPSLNPFSVPRVVAPLAKQNSIATFDRVIEIMENCSAKKSVTQSDLDEFQSLVMQVDTKTMSNYQYSGRTPLQFCCHEGLFDLAEVLLKDGNVDPNRTTNETPIPPLHLAAQKGFGKVIQLLDEYHADFATIAGISNESVLHCLLKNGSRKGPNYIEALEYILSCLDIRADIKKIVNKRDAQNNTPLHYATQKWPQSIVRTLLEIGANIGMKNQWNEMPIVKIDPSTMEDFLDEFCLNSKHDINDDKFELTFNYSFLAPPKEDLPIEALADLKIEDGEDPENQKLSDDEDDHQKFALPETQSLWHMGQSKEHRHLLKHPVITSFLYLKWGRIRRYFNRNVRFYLLFVFILTWFIFENFGGSAIRTEGMRTIPFWHALFSTFAVILIVFIMRDWAMDLKDLMRDEAVKKDHPETTGKPLSSGRLFLLIIFSNWVEVLLILFMGAVAIGGAATLTYALILLLGLLVVRELFQVTVSLKRYLFSPENWIEVSMILCISIILFAPASYDLKRHLCAISIVLSWAELITLVGKHPKLTRYNVYVTMFYKVMGTFFFFLCWYMFFIVAFGLGFFIMMHKEPEDVEKEDYIFFNNPWLALVKTSTMFVGELEFSDIPIDITSHLGILGYIFFLSFVFLIVVVLMNLLNGLAVSDTGEIQNKAEIVSYISRVETISYTESVLLGDPFNFLSNWPRLKWIVSMPSCSFCSTLYKNEILKRLFHKITGSTGILLFYTFLPSKTLTITPNKKDRNCGCLKVNKQTLHR